MLGGESTNKFCDQGLTRPKAMAPGVPASRSFSRPGPRSRPRRAAARSGPRPRPTWPSPPSRWVESRIRPVAPSGRPACWASWPRFRATSSRSEFVPALVGQHVARRFQRDEAADAESRVLPAQGDQAAVEGEDRGRVPGQVLHVAAREGRIERQPRPAGREAGAGGAVPLHRRALRVAAEAEAGLVLLPRVLHARRAGSSTWPHADLVAVVEGRRAAQRQQQHGGDPRLGRRRRGPRCAAGRGCRAPSSASRPRAAPPRTRRSAPRSRGRSRPRG